MRALPAPPLQVNVPTIAACATDSTLLQASGALSYNWSPAQGLSSTDGPQVWAAPAADRWYTVVATGSNGCTAIDSVRVSTQISTRPPLYLVPNAFTPNADGINDCFGIRHWGRLSRLQFRIFDRWGQMVFQTSNADNCWNGRYSNGEPAPSGTYSFAIDASSNCGSIRRKGVVRLIR
ncbi:MAG: gliding motility-associated C-terminal domain-containing protein [Chitinophagaceae bacterium]|nr:gliding motility-associated C-terminal domain-containing protein [Chitinophagaceae bacterium]